MQPLRSPLLSTRPLVFSYERRIPDWYRRLFSSLLIHNSSLFRGFLRGRQVLDKLPRESLLASFGHDGKRGSRDVVAHPGGERAKHLLNFLQVDGIPLKVFPFIAIDFVGIGRRR